MNEQQGPNLPVTGPFPLPTGWRRKNAFSWVHRSGLAVIVSEGTERDGKLWRHVSVSARGRLPTWDELKAVKLLWLGRESLALQVLPPESEYVNHHPNVLHLWQCVGHRPVPDMRRGSTI